MFASHLGRQIICTEVAGERLRRYGVVHDGRLASYAKSYISFSVDTTGIAGVVDWFRHPSELRNGLQKAEAGCCGGH